MTSVIKEYLTMILTCGFTFLVGIGVGAAINETMNQWGMTTRSDSTPTKNEIHKERDTND